MQPVSSALVVTVSLCVITVIGDYMLKRASGHAAPFSSWWFLLGFIVYSSTAFGWVYVMLHLKFATLGAVYALFSVLLLTFVGVVVLREPLSWVEALGIGMAMASIALLSRFAG